MFPTTFEAFSIHKILIRVSEITSYTLLNIFAPTSEKPDKQLEFLEILEGCLTAVDTPSITLGGDFNICLNLEKDK